MNETAPDGSQRGVSPHFVTVTQIVTVPEAFSAEPA